MKRIHIHFSKLTYPDNTEDKVLHTIEEVNKAICNEQEDIHTTQVIYCNYDTIFEFGYSIVVHNSNINYFTISQDGKKCKVTYSDCCKPLYPSEYLNRDFSILRFLETGVPETIAWLTIK